MKSFGIVRFAVTGSTLGTIYISAVLLAPLIDAINAKSVWLLAVQAAEEYRAPDLAPHLIKLRHWWDVDPELLERAIVACSAGELE